MSSKVQIANRALSKLGAGRITSFEDNTKSAKEVSAIYEDLSEEVMSSGAWPSATYRATLAQSTTSPEFEYAYKYALPTSPKCLKVLTLDEQRAGDVRYRIESGFLLTDETAVSIKYIGKVTDSEQYDVYLRRAIVAQLVADLAYTFMGQVTAAEKLIAWAKEEIKDALNNAGTQGSAREIPSDIMIDVRNSG